MSSAASRIDLAGSSAGNGPGTKKAVRRQPGRPSDFAATTEAPVFVDGIGPPLSQIEQDYRDLVDSTCGGVAQDALALIAEVKRLHARRSCALCGLVYAGVITGCRKEGCPNV